MSEELNSDENALKFLHQKLACFFSIFLASKLRINKYLFLTVLGFLVLLSL